MKTPFCGFVFSNLVDGKSFPSSPKAVAALAVPKTEAFEDIPKVSNIQKNGSPPIFRNIQPKYLGFEKNKRIALLCKNDFDL